MHRLVVWAETGLRLFTAGLFSAAILINFANIVGRYLFSAPIYWAEEVTILLVIWAVFLIGFELTLRGEQLKMGLLTAVMPARCDYIVQAVLSLLGALIAAFMVYESVIVVTMVTRFAQTTVVAEIPKWMLFSSITTGFLLITLACLLRAGMMIRAHRAVAADGSTEPSQ